MVEVFRECRRVLRGDGTLWLNLGDSYASGGRGGGMDGPDGEKQRSNQGALLGPKRAPDGLKPKDLCGIPWRVAFALQADGWWLRSDIIWAKPNPMPESVTDRPTKAHEYLFLMAKSERYYYDAAAVREDGAGRMDLGRMKQPEARRNEGGKWANDCGFKDDPSRNRRTVWTVATEPYSEAHFATFPTKLIEPCILAGAPADGVVLDPFMGSGTTALVALKAGRKFVGIELNPKYAAMAESRIAPELNQMRLV
jgi:DNA modification methylase